MRIISTLTAIAASTLLAGGALAASHAAALDADGDGMLTEAEFAPVASMGASFAAYDSDGDGMVSEAEYNDGIVELANPDGGDVNSEEVKMKVDELSKMFSGS